MWKTILDLLFPINCLGCGQAPHQNKFGAGFICANCFKKIPLDENNLYNHPLVKEAIHQYKYNFIKDLAKPLGQLMVKQLKELPDKAVLIPVPLHKKRLRWRGFNQAELLALEVGKKMNWPVINNILIRTKHNLPQVAIKNAQARQDNIKKVFQLNPKNKFNLKNKTIILIDDVSTTGATLKECAQTLKPLQPKQILELIVARG